MTRDEMKQTLNAELCTVLFIKKNGEERLMECTTRNDMIPADKQPSSSNSSTRKENDEVVVAYDVQKADWRSFRVDSVVSFNGVLV